MNRILSFVLIKSKARAQIAQKKLGLKQDHKAGGIAFLKIKCLFCVICVLAIAFAFSSVLANARHPFYVSVCTIEHNMKTKALELTFKITTEDFETVLEEQTKERLHLGSKQESPKADRYIFNYLQKHITLQVDGDTVAFSYVGKEIEIDETWCYVEVVHVPQVRKLAIRNSLLFEKFEAQQNLVHVKVGGKQKSLVLWKDKREGSVEF